MGSSQSTSGGEFGEANEFDPEFDTYSIEPQTKSRKSR